jgi:hypothetical protein
MGERRESRRNKSFLRGRIYFNNRRSATDCLVRDISEIGARLIFSDAISVPDAVELYIPQKEQTLRARVEWRQGDEVGISFPDGMRMDRNDILAQRVERVEAEIASLRRMLRRLKISVAAKDDETA